MLDIIKRLIYNFSEVKMQEKCVVIQKEIIEKYLNESIETLVFDVLPSTSTYLKESIKNGEKTSLVVALMQTNGRGRQGKTFHSPKDSGVYFSFLANTQDNLAVFNFLTVIVAVALKESIEEIFDVRVGIKWVNDIYIGDKKCAGILSEAVICPKTLKTENAIIGIGVNLFEPKNGYNEDIKEIATAVSKNVEDGACRLIASVINKFNYYFKNFDILKEEIFSKYQDYSIMLGRTVEIIGRNGTMATCIAIDDECRLVVEHHNGVKETLYFGEVSLCLK